MITQRQFLLVAALLILSASIVSLKVEWSDKAHTGKQAEIEVKTEVSQYSQSGKVVTIGDNQMQLEFASPVINAAGVAEPSMVTRIVRLSSTEFQKRSGKTFVNAQFSDLRVGQTVVIYSLVDPKEKPLLLAQKVLIQ